MTDEIDFVRDLVSRLIGLEGSTWEGNINVVFVAILIVLVFSHLVFQYVADGLTKIIAMLIGSKARWPFKGAHGSPIKTAIVCMGFLLACVFSVHYLNSKALERQPLQQTPGERVRLG